MMNETQHVLVCLAEECSEVAQTVTKSLRFGLNDSYKDYGNNKERMEQEIIDLLAVLEMIFERKIAVLPDDYEKKIKEKRAKVEKYMAYAREKGELE